MAEPIGDHNIREFLIAFADGEGGVADTLAVLDYLTEHRDARDLMRGQQRLRLAAGRVLRQQTPPISDALRERIAALAASSSRAASAGEETRAPPVADAQPGAPPSPRRPPAA